MRYYKILLTLLLLTALLAGGCGSQQHKKIGSGLLSIPSYEVKAPASGQLIGLITEKGERISQGQPLFAISDPQLDAQVKQLAEQTAKAAAELNRLEQSAVNAPPPGNLASAQAKLTEAQQKAAKMNSLLAQGAVSRQQAQAAQAELQQASASFQAASQAAVSSLPASPQAIAAQQKLLEQLKQQQAQATAKQQANEAISPCTGIVTQLKAANNDAVRQGETIVELKAAESCQISFSASAADVKNLTVGQKVTLKTASASFGGNVSAIDGSSVTVISNNKPADVPAGTAADIYLAN